MSRGVAIAAALVIFCPSAARPCSNVIYLDTDKAAQLVARAEKAVDQGQYQRALRILPGAPYRIEDAGLRRRGALTRAVAELRLGAVDDALDTFVALHRHKRDDPFLRTRIAEGLARLPSDTARGRKILDAKAREIFDDLEQRDLIVDAEGWAGLAQLRERLGDSDGSDRAASRCRAMARSPATCPAERSERLRAARVEVPRS
ncbi:MAG TPA: hypothetical protein VKN99_06305 [Polyangia bacterium]|nr:hypothetical protein [Polyangia bacterium]